MYRKQQNDKIQLFLISNHFKHKWIKLSKINKFKNNNKKTIFNYILLIRYSVFIEGHTQIESEKL